MLDETMSGETMTLSVINKIHNKLKFLYQKNRFLTPALRRLLCNTLIQPQFDYTCSAWYPNLYISYIIYKESEILNSLPVNQLIN